MEFRYQNVNVTDGNESALLHFETADGRDAHVLLDAGSGVDIDQHLGQEEYLNAICLTHAHIDHYRSLGHNLKHSASIYTSPDTADILERALPAAAQHNTMGDTDAVREALTPIEDWTSILDTVDARPVPAGHAPGATGFLFRFRDETLEGELSPTTKYVLATGDFTIRPCAGYPGLATSFPNEVDALILNVATEDSFEEHLNDALETVLERAYAGSRVVVAAGALTGVHVATLLGTLVDRIGRQLTIRLVGQAAKHYDQLGYDVANVETVQTFSSPEDVLDAGTVTIGGPDTAATGSTERLLAAVGDDPGAAFIQLTADESDAVSTATCTTYQRPVMNHPSEEELVGLVDALIPQHVVVKHTAGTRLNHFQREFEKCFTWGTDDEHRHQLYADGEWEPPGWVSDNTVDRITSAHLAAKREASLEMGESFGSLTHGDIDLVAEGVDVDRFTDEFNGIEKPPDPKPETMTAEATNGGTAVAEMSTEKPESSGTSSECSSAEAKTETETVDTLTPDDTILARLDAIESRLDAVETEIETETESAVTARVLSGGPGETFLRILDESDLEPGEIVEIQISRSTPDSE
jgi:putative mRNA 3-end processing factor